MPEDTEVRATLNMGTRLELVMATAQGKGSKVHHVKSVGTPHRPGHPVEELGMSEEELVELRQALVPFKTLWDDPAMDAYDDD